MHKKPVSYQINRKKGQESGIKNEIQVEFKRVRSNLYGFNVGEYDKNMELIIDPVVLVYSTYLGSSGDWDWLYDIVVDAYGCAYVTGITSSTDFPLSNPIRGTIMGDYDVIISKLSPEGNVLDYSTYIGGNYSDGGVAIEIDVSGFIYVTGFTSSTNFPIVNPFQEKYMVKKFPSHIKTLDISCF